MVARFVTKGCADCFNFQVMESLLVDFDNDGVCWNEKLQEAASGRDDVSWKTTWKDDSMWGVVVSDSPADP